MAQTRMLSWSRVLNRCKLRLVLPQDGLVGTNTINAIKKAVQRKYGLAADGIAGTATFRGTE
ncbi:MAG: peptidoglycan-binding domain-containing protein [Clostridia bacterium]